MTCEDCIHRYCCKYDRFFGVDEVENKCNYFKNKADFVEVVRCKDCIYWENGKDYEPYCNNLESPKMYTVEDDFCSYGERRDT